MEFILRLKENELPVIAARYGDVALDDVIIRLVAGVKKRGFLLPDELHEVAHWKSPRIKWRIEKNDPAYVREITKFALETSNERARIASLNLLDGVSWPMASVILHFFHVEDYPILDFRALWSLSIAGRVNYNFKFWWEYVSKCRDIACNNKIDMRTLDRALWQYSKENQK